MHIGIHGIHWIHRGYMRCTVNSFLHAGLRSLGKLPPNIVAHPSLPVRQEMVGMFICISYLIILCFMCLTSSCTDTGHLSTPSGCLKMNQSRCFLGRVGHVRQCHTCPTCAKMQAKWASRWSTRIARMLCGYYWQRCDALQNLLDIAATLWNLSNFPPALFGTFLEFSGALRNLKRLLLSNTSGPPDTSTSTQPSKSVFRILPEPSAAQLVWTFVVTPKLLGQKKYWNAFQQQGQ